VNYNLGTISPKITALPNLPDNLSFSSEDAYTFEIISIEGKVLHQSKIELKNLMATQQIDMPDLEKGTYITRFYNRYEQISEKFVVSE